jgi:hypothetical protein
MCTFALARRRLAEPTRSRLSTTVFKTVCRTVTTSGNESKRAADLRFHVSSLLYDSRGFPANCGPNVAHSAAPPAGAPSPNLALDFPRYPANHGANADPLQELWSWDTLPRSVSAPMTRTSTKVDEGSQGPRMLHASAVTTEPGFGPRQARPFSALARERPLRYREGVIGIVFALHDAGCHPERRAEKPALSHLGPRHPPAQ